MRRTTLTKVFLTTAEEIENNIIGAKKMFRDIKKRAKDLHTARIISLDKSHAREKRTTEGQEKNRGKG